MVLEPVFAVFGVYDSQRLVELFGLIIFFVFFAAIAWPAGVVGNSIGLFFLAGLGAVFFAVKPFWAMLEWGRLFLLFMFSFSLAQWREESVRFAVVSMNGLTVLACLKLLVGLFVISLFGGGIEVLAAGFSNHRHFVEYFIAASTFLAFVLLSTRKFWLLSVVPFSLGWVVLFLGSGRASLLAFLVSFFVYVWLVSDRRCWAVATFFLAALVGWLFSAALILHNPVINDAGRLLRDGGSGRLELWQLALSLWLDNLFFGVGPMHFALYSREIAAHPHSLIIQLLSEWGGVALLAAVVFLGAILLGVYKSRNFLDVNRKAAFSVLIGLLVSSFFGGVFVVPAVEFFFFVMLGLVISSSCFSWRSVGGLSVAVRFFAVGFTALIFIAWLWRGIDVQRGAVIDAPRFWQNGGIPHD